MHAKPVLSALLDVAAGLAAITLVVGSCFASSRIALDFRAMFAVTGLAFFAAGLLRGSSARTATAWPIVRTSVPGLLGTAALVMNNGLHRLEQPVGLIVVALFAVAAGIVARRTWTMARSRSILLGLAAPVAVIAVAYLAVPQLSATLAFDATHKPLPAFELSSGNQTISTSGLRDHVVVMAFWTSWCAQCIQELPQVQQVYKRYRNDPRVAIYAVDLGWYGETPEAGSKCFARHQIDLPIAFDSGIGAKAMGIDAIPAIVLADRAGNIRYTHFGYDMSEDLESGLTRHINNLLASN
jgi:thiol-disulfide isomerase/thioredoxin